jgi:hypothetical protein
MLVRHRLKYKKVFPAYRLPASKCSLTGRLTRDIKPVFAEKGTILFRFKQRAI